MLDAVQDRLRLCNKFPAQGAMTGKQKEKYMAELVDKVKAICPPPPLLASPPPRPTCAWVLAKL